MIGYFNPFEGASIAYGSNITLQMNQSAKDYVITINLINDQGSVISTSSIDLPIESLVKSGRYDSESKTVILILENDDEIEIPISDLISGLQEEITTQNKLDADLVDDSNSINKFNINADWNADGNGAEILNKPTLGTAAQKDMDSILNATSTNPVQNSTLYNRFLEIDANIDALRLMMDATLYGFRIDKNNSDPETRVEYLYDAVGMTPARMSYTTGVFDYGSWANAWFITGNKPVALKFDGTVDYYLDPDDYTKKADGTESDVTDSTYAGNFVASMPTVWVRRWEDKRYSYYAFADKQINSDFKAYAHDAGDGTINDVIYLPMFEGAIIDGKLRSIADVNPTVSELIANCKNAAEACGTGWQMWDWAKYSLIVDLLTLISKSTNSQESFGYGYVSGSKIKTGLADSGRFYGTADKTHAVKIFYIENFWGNCWNYMSGINLTSSQYVYKMARPYSVNPDGSYVYSGLYAPGAGIPISYTVGDFGSLPKTIGGSSTTYFCDRFYSFATDDRIGKFGGSYAGGVDCGAYTLGLHFLTNSPSDGTVGSPCYNAPHST